MPTALSTSTTSDESSVEASLVRQVERLEQIVELLCDAANESRTRHDELLGRLESRMTELASQLSASSAPLSGGSPAEVDSNVRRTADYGLDAADTDSEEVGSGSFLKSWQQQRDEMLNRLSNPDEATTANRSPSHEHATEATPEDKWSVSLEGASPEDLSEIETLKDQLKKAMRDAEIELSMERARMSNERVTLEKRIAELEQREKELTKQANAEPSHKDGRVSRLRKLLGRNGK